MGKHTNLKRRMMVALRKAGCLVTSYNGSIAGVLDLFICSPSGRYAELDIKVGRDKLSKLQQHRIKTVQASGGIASEVRSVEAAMTALHLTCPDCGGATRAASGCMECPACGWSACKV